MNQISSNVLNFNNTKSYLSLKNNIIELFLVSDDNDTKRYISAINDLIKNSLYTIYGVNENNDVIKMGNDTRDLSLDIILSDSCNYKLELKDNFFILSKQFTFFNKNNKVNLLKLSDKIKKLKMIASMK